MSDLTQALNKIAQWVKTNMPDHPAVMNKGLTRKEIEEKVKELPFKLPEEVYELYQWANGGINSFIPHPTGWDLTSFRSLEEAINVMSSSDRKDVFVLFFVEDIAYFIFTTRKRCQTTAIYRNDSFDVIKSEPEYINLTSMMQVIANELTDELLNLSL